METNKQDRIEKFIRENRDEFGADTPPESHMEKFLFKLNRRIRHFINIVPYLIKVAVATVVIFAASVIVWNNFIRKDRNAITLRDKISLEFYRLLD
jgi:hypothetical protein